MRLRVPLAEMMHVAAAAGAGLVMRRVLKRRRAEYFAPAFAPAQAIGVIECVASLVTQNAHEPAGIAALRFPHDATLELLEARVREIERDRDTRHAVRRKPLFGEPHVRAEMDAALFELDVKAPDPAAQR